VEQATPVTEESLFPHRTLAAAPPAGIVVPVTPEPRKPGAMPRRNWTRDETLVAFNLYCRTPFGTDRGIICEATNNARNGRLTPLKVCGRIRRIGE
jgi:hypothetical protein